MILLRFEDNNIDLILLDIWKQSFGALDKNTRQLFCYYMKIYLNRITLDEVFDFGIYEQKRFEIKDKFDKAVIEVKFGNYSKPKYIIIDVISYVTFLFDKPDDMFIESLSTL